LIKYCIPYFDKWFNHFVVDQDDICLFERYCPLEYRDKLTELRLHFMLST